jgi:hypothetical protein
LNEIIISDNYNKIQTVNHLEAIEHDFQTIETNVSLHPLCGCSDLPSNWVDEGYQSSAKNNYTPRDFRKSVIHPLMSQ